MRKEEDEKVNFFIGTDDEEIYNDQDESCDDGPNTTEDVTDLHVSVFNDVREVVVATKSSQDNLQEKQAIKDKRKKKEKGSKWEAKTKKRNPRKHKVSFVDEDENENVNCRILDKEEQVSKDCLFHCYVSITLILIR